MPDKRYNTLITRRFAPPLFHYDSVSYNTRHRTLAALQHMRNTHVGRAALFIAVVLLAPLFAACDKSGTTQSIEELQPHSDWGDDSTNHFFDTTAAYVQPK